MTARFISLALLCVLTLPPALGSPTANLTTSEPPDNEIHSDHYHSDGPGNLRTDGTTTTSLAPLTKCSYTMTIKPHNSLYDNGQGKGLQMWILEFFIQPSPPRCYLTRHDFESQLNFTEDEDAIAGLALRCLGNNRLVFLEDEEVEVLLYNSTLSADRNQYSTSLPDQNRTNPTEEIISTQRKSYKNYISYFQPVNCQIGLNLVEMVANLTDLRVLNIIGDRAWDLSELKSRPELCAAFRNVAAWGVARDWSAQSYLHHLAVCTGSLDNVVEIILSNNSLTSFPQVLQQTFPNLRALDISRNKFQSPVDFPWQSGFAVLPRNLSRTAQFNDDYSLTGAIDIKPNLFRRLLIFNNNRIRNLTHFQFHSDFQYISLERNELADIAENVFDHVPDLQFLSLAFNNLTQLPENLFSKLTSLKRLDLQKNGLTSLPTNIFRNLRKLQNLNLAGNSLHVLQSNLFSDLEKLIELRLENNSIINISDRAFSTLSIKLKSVNLQHNPLKSFPVVLLEMRALTNLNLEFTDIEVLDFVDISSRTTFSRVMEALRNPTTGEYLEAKNGPNMQKIVSLKNSKLRSVMLYNATSETFPLFKVIVQYFTIYTAGSELACDCQILNITHHVQSTLTGQEASLKEWKCEWPSELLGRQVIALRDEETYCPLMEKNDTGSSVSASCPEGCACYVRTGVDTVIVDCQHGGLVSLPSWVPARTKELWLQYNSIETVAKFSYMTDLNSLKLTSNIVRELPVDVLVSLANLYVLYLDDNYLTGLAPDFAKLQQLQIVHLAGNPYRCDCNALWLKGWLLAHQGVVKDWPNIKCSTEGAEGRKLTSVPDAEFICTISATLGDLATPVAISVIFAFALLTLGVVAFLQRRRLKVLLYVYTGIHPFDRDPPDYRAFYDVAVCCDDSIRSWVLSTVLETLEKVGRYRVFFYSRDAFVGFSTSENVRHCVKNSRRLVIVLGKDSQRSELLVTATREGLMKCRKEMVHFLTFLLHQFPVKDIENKEAKQYVQRGRYIMTEDRHFTKKLLYEMPHGKSGHFLLREIYICRGEQSSQSEPVALYDVIAVDDGEANKKVAEQNVQQPSSPSDDGFDDFINADDKSGGHLNMDKCTAGNELVQSRSRHHKPQLQNQLSVESVTSKQLKSVFVWYALEDLSFTLKSIVEPLERRGHSCVLQDRDFPLGAAIQESIVHATETCTRSVFVLSNQTSKNEWFTFAFHVVFERQLQSHDHRVAIVTRDGLDVTQFVEEIQQVLRTTTLLPEDDPWFQQRLKKFIRFEGYEIA